MTSHRDDPADSESTPDPLPGHPSRPALANGPRVAGASTPMSPPASANDATPWIPTTEVPLGPARGVRDEVSE